MMESFTEYFSKHWKWWANAKQFLRYENGKQEWYSFNELLAKAVAEGLAKQAINGQSKKK